MTEWPWDWRVWDRERIDRGMVELGYHRVDGKWRMPIYDWSNHKYEDFDHKDHIGAQRKRGVPARYE